MRLIDSLRKKLYRRRLPPVLAHMKTVHPDFRLQARAGADDAYAIVWKNRIIGHTQPLTALAPAPVPECFIVASGPSLAAVDFSRLRQQVCIGVNGSIVKALESGVAFRYHVIADRNFVRDRFDLVRAALHSGANCLFTFRVLSEISERDPELLQGAENLFLLSEMNARYGVPKLAPAAFDAWAEREEGVFLHPAIRLARGRVGFSKRLEGGVFTAQTVAFSALQVAYGLGFRCVFILGMDLGGDGYRRFYETDQEKPTRTRLDRDFEPYILPSFELARSVTAVDGFEIYNLAPASRLPSDIIPKLTLAEALALCARTDRTPS